MLKSPEICRSVVYGVLIGALSAGGAQAQFPVTIGDIPDGKSLTVTYRAVIEDPLVVASGAVQDQGTVSGSNFADVLTDDPDTAPTGDPTVTGLDLQVDLVVSKVDSIDPVVAGSGVGNLTHTITLRNDGPGDATNVTVSEVVTLPAGTTIVSITPSAGTYLPANDPNGTWTLDLANAASATLTVVMTVGASTAEGATVSDTATATGADQELINTGDDSASESTTVTTEADLSIQKIDSDDPIVAGGTLTYTVTVSNAGPSVAANAVVTDTLPAGVTFVSTTGCAEDPNGVPTCTLGTIAAAGSAQATITVTVDPDTTGTITNSASVTADTTDPDTDNNATSEDTTVLGLDYGDAPAPYPTLLADDGARHVVTGGLPILGTAAPDVEANGQPGVDADGDDNAGTDDEDGVTFTTDLVPGSNATVEVVVSIPTAGINFLDGWIDFDGDGDWQDAGEQVISTTFVVDGVNSFTVAVPAGATPGTTYARFRVSGIVPQEGDGGGGGETGEAPNGEVEDYVVTIGQFDYGDAPDPTYPTLRASDGARHTLGSLFLGSTIDGEADGQPNADASGDGADEDGVTFVDTLLVGATANVEVVVGAIPDPVGADGVGADGSVSAWIDFNADGDWDDSGEQVIDDAAVNIGANTLSVPVPADATVGSTFARFRFSTATGLLPTGAALDGEVEDYPVEIAPAANLSIAKSDDVDPIVVGDTLTYTVTVSNAGPSAAADVVVSDTLPAGVTFVSTSGCAEDPNGVPTCNLGTIAASGSAQATIEVTIDRDTLGTITNSASVSATTTDPDTSDNSTTEDTTVLGLDYGDAPMPYPTLLAADGARHVVTGGLPFIGAVAPDAEADGQPSADADGDDLAGTDDEDGVVFTTDLTPGADATIEVTLSIGTGGPNFLNGMIDFNGDGDWADPGELVISTDSIVDGVNSFTVTVPADAVPGPTYGRFRVNGFLLEGDPSGGELSNGEVEDYPVTIGELDYGDAPDPTYPTLLASDGPRHAVGELFLGATIDGETDGQPNADASGDGDDEDGVTFVDPLVAGTTVTVDVEVGGVLPTAGLVSAWIDFNVDGDWDDAGEEIFTDEPLVDATNTLSYDVPADAVAGDTFARFRMSSAGGLSPTGAAPDGEVEDYSVEIVGEVDLDVSQQARVDQQMAGRLQSYTVEVRNDGPSDAELTFVDTVPPEAYLLVALPSDPAFTCADSDGAAECTGTLAVDETVEFRVDVLIDPLTVGTIDNTATVSSPFTDPDTSNNESVATTDVLEVVDLEIVPDVDGSGVDEIAVALNGSPAMIHIRDAETGATINDIPIFQPGWIPIDLEIVPDIDGLGSDEVAVLVENESTGVVHVFVFDAATGVQIARRGVSLGDSAALDLEVVDDFGETPASELVVLYRNFTRDRSQVIFKDPMVEQQIVRHSFDPIFFGIDLEVLSDFGGAATEEVVVMTTEVLRGGVQAWVRDSSTAADLGQTFLTSDNLPIDLEGVVSFGDTAADELLLAVEDTRSASGRLIVRDGETGVELTRDSLAAAFQGRDVELLSGLATQPASDIGVLMRRRSDGAERVCLRDVAGAGLLGRRPVGETAFDLEIVPDFAGTTSDELATLAMTPGGWQVEVRDATAGGVLTIVPIP